MDFERLSQSGDHGKTERLIKPKDSDNVKTIFHNHSVASVIYFSRHLSVSPYSKSHQQSYSTWSPVSTEMGDRLRVHRLST